MNPLLYVTILPSQPALIRSLSLPPRPPPPPKKNSDWFWYEPSCPLHQPGALCCPWIRPWTAPCPGNPA